MSSVSNSRFEIIGVSVLEDTRPGATQPGVEGTAALPRTPVEEALMRVWIEVLDAENIGIHDNFFMLGGNSLVVTQVMARVRDLFSVEIPLRQLFETPTVAGMAEQVEAALRKGTQLEAPPLQAGLRPQHIPLSFSQERMWLIYQLDPTSAAYNMVGALRFKGQLDLAALDYAIHELANRHESLRTSFELVEGQPVQIIAPSLELEIEQTDLCHLPAQEREPRAVKLAGQEAQQPFDLRQPPLWQLSLYCLAADENLLVINMHHTICDAWSLGVMLQELAAFYTAYQTGQPAQLPALPVQYADYSIWQRNWLHGEVLEAHLDYWRQQLVGVPVLELPTDYPRPAVQTFRGAYQSVPLPDTLLDALREFSSAEGTTLFMTLLTAFKVLLLRYTGQTDIAVGTPIANRQWQAVEGLIGTFVNTLVFRTDVSGNLTFRELLQRVREVSLDAYAHQDMPFAKLVAELQPDRDLSYSPLVQVMFNVVNVPLAMPAMPGVTLDFVEIDRRAAQFDLSLTILDTSAMRLAALEYNTDLFDDETITRLLNHYLILLEQIARDPNQRVADVPLLPEAERRLILETWNATSQDYPRDLCTQQLFEAQANRTPAAIAIRGYALDGTETSLTYGDLDRRANQLAHYLRDKGVKPGVLVGVSVERTVEMVIGLLGILKAGGAYVPLDPAFPADRLAFMLEDAGLSILLTQARLKTELPAHIAAGAICLDSDWAAIAQENAGPLAATAGPSDLAYILYTSGSTGKPKGVQIPHRALTNFLVSMQREPGLDAQDRLLAITTLSFDIAGLELYLPLITGASLILAKREEAADGLRLIELLGLFDITVLQATPATWRMLIEVGWQGTPGLKMLCGGEALPRDLALQLLERGGSLWNMYGPTETTIWSSTYEVKREDGLIHLGHPIANTQLYVLDSQRQPVPIGVTGELYIGGEGVALGYLNRPELTSERFLPDPFQARPEARMYRTGDLVRYRADGTLEFLGRADFQVKVRGFRIELGEIETVIGKHPAVQQVVVTAREDRPGDKRLVAYVVPRPGQSPVANGLSGFVREQLPDYMVPTAFVSLEALPLTPNNKVDRKALPAPDLQRLESATPFVAPRNPVEVALAAIWAEVLGIEKIGIHENFFDLGGHSLLATQVISRVRRQFEVDLPLRDLFENPTVAGLAAGIEAIQWAAGQQTTPYQGAPFEREEIEL